MDVAHTHVFGSTEGTCCASGSIWHTVRTLNRCGKRRSSMVPSAGPRSVAVHSTVIFAMAACSSDSCTMPAQRHVWSRQAVRLNKKPVEHSAISCVPVCCAFLSAVEWRQAGALQHACELARRSDNTEGGDAVTCEQRSSATCRTVLLGVGAEVELDGALVHGDDAQVAGHGVQLAVGRVARRRLRRRQARGRLPAGPRGQGCAHTEGLGLRHGRRWPPSMWSLRNQPDIPLLGI